MFHGLSNVGFSRPGHSMIRIFTRISHVSVYVFYTYIFYVFYTYLFTSCAKDPPVPTIQAQTVVFVPVPRDPLSS